MSSAAQVFEAHRGLLFSIAYRMLASVADAEDVVQEAFLRWRRRDDALVQSPKAYLATIVTRLCIDHLRSARVRREHPADVVLPEPVDTRATDLTLEASRLADSISVAFLVMLERLSPVERAVFLLREALDYDYAAIALVVGKSEAHCRQIAKRAKERLALRRDETRRPSAGEVERVVERFLSLSRTGDVEGLLRILSPEVTLYADGGSERPAYGRARAVRRPIRGAEAVARFLIGVQKQAPSGVEGRLREINGERALVAYVDGRLHSVLSFEIDAGRIEAIFIVGDPAKLSKLA